MFGLKDDSSSINFANHIVFFLCSFIIFCYQNDTIMSSNLFYIFIPIRKFLCTYGTLFGDNRFKVPSFFSISFF